ncbi:MAG: hypothetical protein QNI84_05700 [Henriciella sp.]|nr:hypothetical protein [Henriciella sp.]
MRAYDAFMVAFAAMSFVILGWVTVSGSSIYHKSAAELENLLETKVADALLAGGFDWAAVEMDGQYATLYGTPPNQTAASAAEEAALTAAGGGGWLRGGVTGVVTKFEPITRHRELLIGAPDTPNRIAHRAGKDGAEAALTAAPTLRQVFGGSNQRVQIGFQEWSE